MIFKFCIEIVVQLQSDLRKNLVHRKGSCLQIKGHFFHTDLQQILGYRFVRGIIFAELEAEDGSTTVVYSSEQKVDAMK